MTEQSSTHIRVRTETAEALENFRQVVKRHGYGIPDHGERGTVGIRNADTATQGELVAYAVRLATACLVPDNRIAAQESAFVEFHRKLKELTQ